MVVTQESFKAVLEQLSQESELSIDTETTGLRPYHGDRLFSVIIGSRRGSFYFNFCTYAEEAPNLSGRKEEFGKFLASSPSRTWYLHNAKFDLAFLLQEGWDLCGKIVDTMGLARIEFNQYLDYSLDAVAAREKFTKLDTVERYIKENKLFSREVRGKKLLKKPLYNQVPFSIISEYGLRDAEITFDVAKNLTSRIMTRPAPNACPNPEKLLAVDSRLNRVVFDMERIGVKVDLDYCDRAEKYFQDEIKRGEQRFFELTGKSYQPSPKLYKEIFGVELVPRTEKGNPQYNVDALKKLEHPAAKVVLQIRDAQKSSEYYENFKYFADSNGAIHCNLNISGTRTGRFSASSPNLQNMTSPDEDNPELEMYPVRRAIVPRETFYFAMIDYSQMEYRLLLEYAKARNLIDKVNSGLDVHAATAELAGVTRKQAKTVNFATVFGSGDKTLSEQLKCSIEEAKRIKKAIFDASPELAILLTQVKRMAEKRGYIFNWMGRRSHFPDPRFSYQAPNHLIQGSCADIMKLAMVQMADYLSDKKSRLVLTIHDEVVIEVHQDEGFVVDECKRIMETAYDSKLIPLLTDVEYSTISLADKVDTRP